MVYERRGSERSESSPNTVIAGFWHLRVLRVAPLIAGTIVTKDSATGGGQRKPRGADP
jgi:hypothetical protein